MQLCILKSNRIHRLLDWAAICCCKRISEFNSFPSKSGFTFGQLWSSWVACLVLFCWSLSYLTHDKKGRFQRAWSIIRSQISVIFNAHYLTYQLIVKNPGIFLHLLRKINIHYIIHSTKYIQKVQLPRKWKLSIQRTSFVSKHFCHPT